MKLLRSIVNPLNLLFLVVIIIGLGSRNEVCGSCSEGFGPCNDLVIVDVKYDGYETESDSSGELNAKIRWILGVILVVIFALIGVICVIMGGRFLHQRHLKSTSYNDSCCRSIV